MKNGRCRLHGGLSTGPRTPEGLERSRRARWKHGRYSREAKQAAREARWNDPGYVEAQRQAFKRQMERESRRTWRKLKADWNNAESALLERIASLRRQRAGEP